MKSWVATLLAGVPCALLLSACSLDVPKNHGDGQLNIILLHPNKALDEAFSELTFNAPIFLASAPTSLSDFSCFGINVSGEQIPAHSAQLTKCTGTPGFAIGELSKVGTSGSVFSVSVPPGTNRTITALGILPINGLSECGSSGSLVDRSGYVLGQKTVDLTGDQTIAISTSFTSGQAAAMTCNEGNFIPFTLVMDGTQGTGKFTSSCLNPTGLTTTSPAPGSLSPVSSMTGSNYSLLNGAGVDTEECTASGSNTVEAQEFSFFVGTNVTAGASSIKVEFFGAAGKYSGTCSGGSTLSSGGGSPRVEVWNNTTAHWVSVGSITTAQAAVFQTFSVPGDFISSGTISVRIVGDTATSTNCSEIDTDVVKVSFN